MNKQEYAAYGEFGLTDRVTILGRIGLQSLSEDRQSTSEDQTNILQQSAFGVGGVEIGSRVRFARHNAWVFSSQMMLGVPGAGENANNLSFGDSGGDVDLRFLAGRSIDSAKFISISAGWRNRRGLPSDEWRFVIAMGHKFTNGIETHAQTYSVISEPGGDIGPSSYQGHRLQLTALLPISRKARLQISALNSLYSHNIADERAVILGVWRKF